MPSLKEGTEHWGLEGTLLCCFQRFCGFRGSESPDPIGAGGNLTRDSPQRTIVEGQIPHVNLIVKRLETLYTNLHWMGDTEQRKHTNNPPVEEEPHIGTGIAYKSTQHDMGSSINPTKPPSHVSWGLRVEGILNLGPRFQSSSLVEMLMSCERVQEQGPKDLGTKFPMSPPLGFSNPSVLVG